MEYNHILKKFMLRGWSLLLSDKQMIGLVVVGLGASWYLKNKAVETAKEVGEAINPTNYDNVFNQTVLSIGQEISGDNSWSLGGWIYDITH